MYSLVILAIFCATINNLLLHILSKKEKDCDPYLFNAMLVSVWVVGLVALNLGIRAWSNWTIIYGCIYGIALAGFIFFKTQAMASGPLALTAVIGCSSFIATTIFNAIYWKEKVGFFEIAGIVLMIVAVIMVNYTPQSDTEEKEKKKTSLLWKIYSGLFFFFSALTGIIFRMHQNCDSKNTNEMMILASIVTIIILAVLFLFNRIIKKRKLEQGLIKPEEYKIPINKTIILLALGSGIVSCVYNRLNIYNSGVLPSTIFFPLFNGGVVISSFLVGRIFFKEKTLWVQIVGIVLGVIAIILVSKCFGLIQI